MRLVTAGRAHPRQDDARALAAPDLSIPKQLAPLLYGAVKALYHYARCCHSDLRAFRVLSLSQALARAAQRATSPPRAHSCS